MKYIDGEIYDNKILLDIFCIITIIVLSIYILTSVICSYGIVNENWLALVPWICVNIIMSMLLAILIAIELHMVVEGLGKVHFSENFLINVFSLFYITFNWIVGLIIIGKLKKYPKVGQDECSQITYLELQNLNEEI